MFKNEVMVLFAYLFIYFYLVVYLIYLMRVLFVCNACVIIITRLEYGCTQIEEKKRSRFFKLAVRYLISD